MKILIDARFYGLENAGIGRYVMNLVKELAKVNKKNEYIIFLREKYYKTLTLPKNWEKVRVDIPHYSLQEQFELPKLLQSVKLDLVHFPHFNVPILGSSPFVVTIHDLIKHTWRGPETTTRTPLIYWLKYAGYRLVFLNAVGRAKKIIVPSNWVKGELERAYAISSEKIVVTQEGVDEIFKNGNERNQEKKKILEKYKIKKPYLIYAGSAYPHKNIERLIEAVKLVNTNQLPVTSLVIASARNVFLERLENHIRKTGTRNVKLLNFIPDEELAVLYNRATAFVFPTLSEGFGLPGLEAMASGTAVLASDIPVLREVYDGAALYFDPRNPEDIADKIKLVLLNKRLQADLVAKGKEQVKSYSWRKLAQKTLNVYKEVASS